MHSHCSQDPCRNFCITQNQICFFEYIKPFIEQMIADDTPDMTVINALLGNVIDYSSAEKKEFRCDDVIIFKGVLYKSLKNFNDRHPHDKNAWVEVGNLFDVIEQVRSLSNSAIMKFDYYESCTDDNCVSLIKAGTIVATKVSTNKYDDCGKLIYKDVFYQANVDTSDKPSEDSEDWNGPYSLFDLFNLAIGQDLLGNPIKPSDNRCLLTCDNIGTGLAVEDGALVVGEIGVDTAGDPIKAGGDNCLLTCENLGEGLIIVDGKVVIDPEWLKVQIQATIQNLPNC